MEKSNLIASHISHGVFWDTRWVTVPTELVKYIASVSKEDFELPVGVVSQSGDSVDIKQIRGTIPQERNWTADGYVDTFYHEVVISLELGRHRSLEVTAAVPDNPLVAYW